MRFDDEISNLPLAILSAHLQSGELSPVEVTHAALNRIEQHDPELQAFVAVTRERALAEAAQAERELANGDSRGPLHGVPYAAKDLFDVEGWATGAGTHLLADNIAQRDATVIARLAAAGMVLVGKTHTVQFAFGGVGINHDTGTPRNPHFSTPHTPGGSSSGSGVAVAAGLVPVALGTDTSGSVRIPASLCGIVGLKTTVGRVSRTGVYPLSPTLDSVGPLARTVDGCAWMYEAIQGADLAGDPTTWAQTPHQVTSGLDRGVEGLRLAIAETLFFDDCDPEIEAAVRSAAVAFSALGAEIESIEIADAATVLSVPDDPIDRALVVSAEGFHVNRKLIEQHRDEIDPAVAYRLMAGQSLTATNYLATLQEWQHATGRAGDAVDGFDAWLVPTTIQPSRPIEQVDATIESYAEYNAALLRNTGVGNRLQWCGVSIPCGTTSAGAPIGLMVYARPGDEHIALRVSAAFERAQESAPPTTSAG